MTNIDPAAISKQLGYSKEQMITLIMKFSKKTGVNKQSVAAIMKYVEKFKPDIKATFLIPGIARVLGLQESEVQAVLTYLNGGKLKK